MAAKKRVSIMPTPKGVIYQAKSGAIELRGDFKRETLWATQADMAKIFGVTPQNITFHIKNIFKDGELGERATCKDSLQVQKEGTRYVERQVKLYNLEVIIATGYRVNSIVGTRFRQWATKTLSSYIVDGYAINRKQIGANYEQFLKAVQEVQKLLPSGSAMNPSDAMELVSLFADTWLSLDAYDKDALPTGKLTKKKVMLTADKIIKSLAELRHALMKRGEASELFGAERAAGSVAGIVGNVMQSFGGTELYPSAEEKAAHLLYFMVKNHPFSDGNKRSGAYAFVWFLRHAGILDVRKLSPAALTAITILVAESDPAHKERVIRLVLHLITNKA